jgi:predicted kinase
MEQRKKKINLPKFILVMNGPSCSGKSTVADYFFENYSRIFIAKRDRIKRLISDYDSFKDIELTQNMIFSLIQVAVKGNLFIIQDQGIGNHQMRKYKNLAKKFNCKFVEVNVEANFESISSRFHERIEAAKLGAKISLTDPKIMKERYENYLKIKKRKIPTFYTDSSHVEEIVKKIISIIKKS